MERTLNQQVEEAVLKIFLIILKFRISYASKAFLLRFFGFVGMEILKNCTRTQLTFFYKLSACRNEKGKNVKNIKDN